mgnify:CR=1 FL=1|tara:strand:+ start:1911 stop:2438 length:528 start_codon:yes stop_codon:yes gene_type:complete
MTKLILHSTIVFLLLFCLSNCAVFTKTESGYINFTKESKLDSTKLSFKRHLQKFTKAIQNKQDINNLLADSLYCFWEVGGDTSFTKFNSNKISKQDYIKNYYPKMFSNTYVEYINQDENIFSIYKFTSPFLDNKKLSGFSATFGPKKCIWEPCSYENFEFIKTKSGYKLYKVWYN